MRILGIDPGLATVGYGVLDTHNNLDLIECGCITTLAGTDNCLRLDQIATDLNAIITEFKPQVMAIESLFFTKNIKTGITVAQARGVMLYIANKQGLEIFEYNPLQVKLSVSGDGNADKRQIQDMVKKTLDLPSYPKPDDAADAVAIALTHSFLIH